MNYTIIKENLNFILEETNSTIDDFIKWLKFIKREYHSARFPCIRYEKGDGKYLGKYSFDDREERECEYNFTETPEDETCKEVTIYIGSIVEEADNIFDLWDNIRENDEEFNKLIKALELEQQNVDT